MHGSRTWWLSPVVAMGAACSSTGARPALVPTVAFTSTRHDSAAVRLYPVAEIYFANEDMTNVRRITTNGFYDAFPTISPDGTRVMFDSAERGGSTWNNPDLYVMAVDGSGRAYLDHGASGTWSRDSKVVAYHASASGKGAAIRPQPSAATIDSDIFTLNVDDFLAGVAHRSNITNSPDAVDEDPDWSPTADVIIYTSHSVTSSQGSPADAEIYLRNADGTGAATRLTQNTQEERAPAWSPDGTKIVYMCKEVFDEATRMPIIVGPDFEICVMNANGTGQRALTHNTVGDLTPNWSVDGTKIFFHRSVPVSGPTYLEMFLMNADGTGLRQLTSPPGHNAFPNPGSVRARIPD